MTFLRLRLLSWVLPVLIVGVGTIVHAEEETGLQVLRQDLAKATADYGKAIHRCTPEAAIPEEVIGEVRQIPLARERLIRALGWLALERRGACERVERQALAEAVLRLRLALRAASADTRKVEQIAQTLWGDSLSMAALQAEYESLPEAVRVRLGAIPALQRPFDLLPFLERLDSSPNTPSQRTPVE